MRIAVIADTHFPSRGPELPGACRRRLSGADAIVHAGDHSSAESLHRLRGLGPPVYAVAGNVDDEIIRATVPHEIEVTLGGIRVAVIHDAGPARGRHARLARRFPDADVVIFGHSHIPVVERDPQARLFINPGSPTDRRRQPHHTMAELVIRPGAPPVARIIVVDPDRGDTGEND